VSMKKVTVAQEIEVSENEFGVRTYVGNYVLVFTTTYIYYGFLKACNCDFIQIDNPYIVYETNTFSEINFKDAQKVSSNSLLLNIGHIETIFVTSQKVK